MKLTRPFIERNKIKILIMNFSLTFVTPGILCKMLAIVFFMTTKYHNSQAFSTFQKITEPLMTGYDWKAHHRETNNLAGLLWDFIGGRPRIAALFYSHELEEADWGKIVHPRDGGGKTTSLSIMNRSGIRKMYAGWICVLSEGGYREFLNRKNKGERIR
jgi:hypothetical protein